jgi:hypothetical protein
METSAKPVAMAQLTAAGSMKTFDGARLTKSRHSSRIAGFGERMLTEIIG